MPCDGSEEEVCEHKVGAERLRRCAGPLPVSVVMVLLLPPPRCRYRARGSRGHHGGWSRLSRLMVWAGGGNGAFSRIARVDDELIGMANPSSDLGASAHHVRRGGNAGVVSTQAGRHSYHLTRATTTTAIGEGGGPPRLPVVVLVFISVPLVEGSLFVVRLACCALCAVLVVRALYRAIRI
jgi:hypothetical protein